jgi:uncharacterized protein (TIGR02145 family)
MKMVWSVAVVVVVVGLAVPALRAGDRPIVAIFGVDAAKAKLSQDLVDQLPDYLATKLTESGKYQVIPREQVKDRLAEEKKKTYKKCYDQSCQIEIGKELAAEKTLSTKIMKLGSRCTVTLTLYDIRRATTESAASQHGGCKDDAVVESMDKALAKLFGESSAARGKPKAEEQEKGIAERTEATKEVRQPGTNLHWLRCPLGQTLIGSACQGNAKKMEWSQAMKACPAGYRLPTKEELRVLLGSNRDGCAKNKTCKYIFGNDELYYWSSSVLDSSDAFAGFFKEGLTGSTKRDNSFCVRCLRVGSATTWAKDSNEPESEALRKAWEAVKDVVFNDEIDQKIRMAGLNKFLSDFPKDNIYEQEAKALIALTRLKEVKQPGTDLYWLRCPLGQTLNGSACQGNAKKMIWNQAMKACPAGYRLPTRQEFMNLLGDCDEKVRGGKDFYGNCASYEKSARCSSMFGKSDNKFYWSSSSLAENTEYAWYAFLLNGRVSIAEKSTYDSYVRCVRGGP